MAARRVFIIWRHPLFHDSLRLLLNHPSVEWIGEASDFDTASKQIFHHQPDTILVEEALVEGSTREKMMELMQASSWNLRVIGLNMQDNRTKLFLYEEGEVLQADDLLHIILEE